MKTAGNTNQRNDLKNTENVAFLPQSAYTTKRCPYCSQRLFDVSTYSVIVIQIKCTRCGEIVNVFLDDLNNEAG